MNRERVEELWLGYVHGTLHDAGDRLELLNALQSDPALCEELLLDRALDGILRESGRSASEAGELEREIAAALRAEKDRSQFVEHVRLRIKRDLTASEADLARPQPSLRASRRASLRARVRRMGQGSRVGWVLAAAAAIFLVALAGLYRMADEKGLAQVVRLDAPATASVRPFLQRDRVAGETVHLGMSVRSGDRIETLGGSVDLALDRGRTLLKAGPSTSFGILQTEEGKRISLPAGMLTAEVSPQPDGKPLVVATPDATAQVIGTRFTVTVRDGFTRLDVHEGQVLFTRFSDQAAIRVAAGLCAQTRDARLAARSQSAPIATVVNRIEAMPAPRKEPSSEVARVVSFTLIDTDTDLPMPGFDPLPDGATVKLSALPTRNINLRANTEPEQLARIHFVVRGPVDYRFWNEPIPNENTEAEPPYALLGDDHGDYAPWKVVPGAHTVTAVPFAGKKGAPGKAGQALTIRFTVEE